MKTNRSMPPSAVIPVLAYPDVRMAVGWLCGAFGFEERLQVTTHRAQLSFAGGALVISEAGTPSAQSRSAMTAHSVLVRVEDVDQHHEQAKKSGALIVKPPENYPYGERQYTAEDLAGHLWTFSQTIADVAPETWGGVLFEAPPGKTADKARAAKPKAK